EEFIGNALRELGVKREEVVIATKIPGDFLNSIDILKSIDSSMKRLGLNYIDLLQIHWPPCWHNFPTCEYARVIERAVKLGKVNYIGVSNYPIVLIEELRSCFSTIDIVSMQYRYNLVEREAEKELIPYAEANSFTFLAWSPIAKGALSGKYSIDNLPIFKDLRSTDPIFHTENFSKIQRVVDILKELSIKYGKKPVQIAINWLISYSSSIVPIPGAKSPDQVIDNANSVGWRLSYSDWRLLDEASRNINISYAVWYLK
ncbi:MAG: aldo/keto reductase, partial [Desulfurococcaceae archaeon]